MRNEQRLAQRIHQGDPKAFEEFVDAYGARVHRLVRRYVDNASDVEDVTQEIFVDVYRSIGNFRGESALMTWVYRVALHRCLRHCQRTRPDALPYDEQDAQAEADWHADPALCLAQRELSDQVQNALNQLSASHQDVVVLCELHGLTYRECAQVLEVPVGTVKSRLFHAFRRLRVSLGGYVLGETGAPVCDTLGESAP